MTTEPWKIASDPIELVGDDEEAPHKRAFVESESGQSENRIQLNDAADVRHAALNSNTKVQVKKEQSSAEDQEDSLLQNAWHHLIDELRYSMPSIIATGVFLFFIVVYGITYCISRTERDTTPVSLACGALFCWSGSPDMAYFNLARAEQPDVSRGRAEQACLGYVSQVLPPWTSKALTTRALTDSDMPREISPTVEKSIRRMPIYKQSWFVKKRMAKAAIDRFGYGEAIEDLKAEIEDLKAEMKQKKGFKDARFELAEAEQYLWILYASTGRYVELVNFNPVSHSDDPDHMLAIRKVSALCHLNRFSEAEELLRSLPVGRFGTENFIWKLRILALEGKVDEAMDLCLQQKNLDSAERKLVLGELYALKGQYKKAAELIREVTSRSLAERLVYGTPEAQCMQGAILLEAKDYAAATQILINENNAGRASSAFFYALRAETFFKTGLLSSAQCEIEKALKINPSLAKANEVGILIFTKAGLLRQAAECTDRLKRDQTKVPEWM